MPHHKEEDLSKKDSTEESFNGKKFHRLSEEEKEDIAEAKAEKKDAANEAKQDAKEEKDAANSEKQEAKMEAVAEASQEKADAAMEKKEGIAE